MTPEAALKAAYWHHRETAGGWHTAPGSGKPCQDECIPAILAALPPGWTLVPTAVSADEHKPGDPHQYRIECEVCGERGTIRLSVDPETWQR